MCHYIIYNKSDWMKGDVPILIHFWYFLLLVHLVISSELGWEKEALPFTTATLRYACRGDFPKAW